MLCHISPLDCELLKGMNCAWSLVIVALNKSSLPAMRGETPGTAPFAHIPTPWPWDFLLAPHSTIISNLEEIIFFAGKSLGAQLTLML